MALGKIQFYEHGVESLAGIMGGETLQFSVNSSAISVRDITLGFRPAIWLKQCAFGF
jgi:hypothetical protein